jgi:hypothetical protein
MGKGIDFGMFSVVAGMAGAIYINGVAVTKYKRRVLIPASLTQPCDHIFSTTIVY